MNASGKEDFFNYEEGLKNAKSPPRHNLPDADKKSSFGNSGTIMFISIYSIAASHHKSTNFIT